jgi:acetolactate decarboxylase
VTNDARGHFRTWARTMLCHHHGSRHGPEAAREIYQTSTMGALLDGIYDGDMTVGELLTHGNFGLGTFNHLDGEMIVLAGVCHHLRSDGSASVAAVDDRTPFAAVTWFRPEITIPVPSPATRQHVVALVDEAIKSTNLIQAVRIDGPSHDTHGYGAIPAIPAADRGHSDPPARPYQAHHPLGGPRRSLSGWLVSNGLCVA